MPTAENALLQYEAAQTLVAYEDLTDQGDNTEFKSVNYFFSDVSGYEPVVRPNGIASGPQTIVTPAVSGTSDYVDTAAITVYLIGVSTTVAASTDNEAPRADSDYWLLSFAAGGYTNCVAGDVSKAVVGGVTADSGTLLAYNNTTRQWLIQQDDSGDTFDDDDEAITITTGTGAGTLNAIGVASSYKINSITVNSSGAIAIVEGFPGSSFSTTRAAIGGPPLIPTTSIELAHVKYTAAASAAVTASEILQVPGTSQEWYNYPTWTVDHFDVSNGVLGLAGVTFTSALPAIHTGAVPKKVYVQYYTPTFAEVPDAYDFVPPANSHSVNSTQVYGRTVASRSASLGQGSFSTIMSDGISDGIIAQVDKNIFFRFYQDRLKAPYIICQGQLGITRSFPAGDSISAACTISAGAVSKDVTA
uniref:Uncharacterized protein n=1 Tax=viral metagenome TaxID=1070528 RepID=A0A6M3J5A3_9ZZZZ